MKSAKTGTSMSGVINTRSKKHYAITQKKDNQKIKRAKICIECKSNQEGYCNKHKNWCGKVNYICLGIKDPYEYKPPKPKNKTNKKKSNKNTLGLSSKDLKKTKQLRGQLEKNPQKTIEKLTKMNKIK